MSTIRFGTNGWRARANEDFSEKDVASIAAALGLAWGSSAVDAHTILVTYDTREKSHAYARLCAGILATYGLTVELTRQPCPTSALGWSIAHNPEALGGIALTAGDAQADYLGLIARGSDGGPVSETFAQLVDKLITSSENEGQGIIAATQILPSYFEALRSHCEVKNLQKRSLHVVLDGMHGVCACHVPEFFASLGCEVSVIHGGYKADFGGLHPECCEPWVDDCEQAVVELGADLGIVFDGDGSRAAFIDEKGQLLAPHVSMPLIIEHLVDVFPHHPPRLALTLASSARLARQAARLGLELSWVPVGFSRLYSELVQGDVLCACDEYGGMSFAHHFPERDAILAAVYLVDYLATVPKTLSELVAELEQNVGKMYYAKKDVRLDVAALQSFCNLLPGLNPRTLAGRVPIEVSHADGMKVYFENDAWVMLRPSRSLPLVRVYAEAQTIEDRDNLLAAAAELAQGDVDDSLAT